jgi:hypothetical protein
MIQCLCCGAYILDEDKLIKYKEDYIDIAPKGSDTEKVDASYNYYICPKCGYENFVDDSH